jgi:hypothetical protein
LPLSRPPVRLVDQQHAGHHPARRIAAAQRSPGRPCGPG